MDAQSESTYNDWFYANAIRAVSRCNYDPKNDGEMTTEGEEAGNYSLRYAIVTALESCHDEEIGPPAIEYVLSILPEDGEPLQNAFIAYAILLETRAAMIANIGERSRDREIAAEAKAEDPKDTKKRDEDIRRSAGYDTADRATDRAHRDTVDERGISESASEGMEFKDEVSGSPVRVFGKNVRELFLGITQQCKPGRIQPLLDAMVEVEEGEKPRKFIDTIAHIDRPGSVIQEIRDRIRHIRRPRTSGDDRMQEM